MENQPTNPAGGSSFVQDETARYAPGHMTDERLYLTEKGESSMVSIANWGFFFAILGCLGAGIMILVGLSMLAAGSMTGAYSEELGLDGGFMRWMSFFYLFIAAIYLVPCVFMFKFSSKVKNTVRFSRSSTDLEDSIRYLKNTFKYLGIMTIVGIVLSIVMFVVILSKTMASVSSLSEFYSYL